MLKLNRMMTIAAILVVLAHASAVNAEMPRLATGWLPGYEAFPAWLAVQRGWDLEFGVQLDLKRYDSALDQLNAFRSRQWVLGAAGPIPQLMAALHYDSRLIGLAADESRASAVFVRPGSPVLETKGWNPDYPDVLGRPDAIRGMTILTTAFSTAHYLLDSWLKLFGLGEREVTVRFIDQASIMNAFESGVGDAACIRAPYAYTALLRGWKPAADAESCRAELPIALLCDREFSQQHPVLIEKFLTLYLQSVDRITREGDEAHYLQRYQDFYREWAGVSLTPRLLELEARMHSRYHPAEQLQMLQRVSGESALTRSQHRLARFFHDQGKLTDAELDRLTTRDYIADEYLMKAVQNLPGP